MCGGYYRCTGTSFQGFLILNIMNLKLLIEVSGCFVSMAAESSDQMRAACSVLGSRSASYARNQELSVTSTGSGGPGDG